LLLDGRDLGGYCRPAAERRGQNFFGVSFVTRQEGGALRQQRAGQIRQLVMFDLAGCADVPAVRLLDVGVDAVDHDLLAVAKQIELLVSADIRRNDLAGDLALSK
jgi:hypothetical protein